MTSKGHLLLFMGLFSMLTVPPKLISGEGYVDVTVVPAPDHYVRYTSGNVIYVEGLVDGRWVGRYMRALIAERRNDPKDDLVSALIQAEDEKGALSEPELSSAISTIYTAAGTTTERFISSGLYLLLSHGEQWRALVEDRTLVAPALE